LTFVLLTCNIAQNIIARKTQPAKNEITKKNITGADRIGKWSASGNNYYPV
jgi:hypothetical protein